MSAAANRATHDDLPMRRVSQSLPMALLRAREKLMEGFRPLLREHGLTEQQWRVLRVLVEHGPLEVTELAREALILAPSLSRITARLAARGLVVRRTDTRDQRRVRIALGARGRRLFEQIAPRSEAHYAAIGGAFGAERLAEVFSLLDDLGRVLEELHATAVEEAGG